MKLLLKYERQDKSGDCISFVVYKTSLGTFIRESN